MRRRITVGLRRAFQTPRHLLVSLGLAAGACALALCAVELIFWKLNFPFAGDWVAAETPLARFDPEAGWSYIPNQSVVGQFGAEHRTVPMFFDVIGARVGTPEAKHDPLAPTIVFLGCSLTMGHGLPWEETFVGRLEARPDFPFQVVNLGVQAYGTDQSFVLLRRHMRDFNTKVVVYTFMDDHVARNTNDDRRLFYPQGKFVGTKPLFRLAPDGSLALQKAPHRYEDVWQSRIWSALRLAWTEWGPIPDGAVTRALVRDMRRFVEANGAKFVMVRWPESRFPFHAPGLNEIDLGPMVPPAWKEWMIPEDGHPDARADAFVANVLAERLKALGGVNAAAVASDRRVPSR